MFDPTLRLYAIVRTDIQMPPGKMAAQAGHAFVQAIQDALQRGSTDVEQYLADPPGTKVVLNGRDLDTLLVAQAYAESMGIPNALITDSGHVLPPHFDGSPIVTALGIGPTTRDWSDHITSKMRLL